MNKFNMELNCPVLRKVLYHDGNYIGSQDSSSSCAGSDFEVMKINLSDILPMNDCNLLDFE